MSWFVSTHDMDIEDALRASEIRYRRLFETAKDGILILDVDTGCINDVNPFFSSSVNYWVFLTPK